MTVPVQPAAISSCGRYAIYDEIAAGGMATVHYGRLLGPSGFSRTVAIKRLHAHLAKDPELCSSLLDEARMAARIRHHNVVSSLDVVRSEGEFLLVMEYVHGVSLATVMKTVAEKRERIPAEVVVALLSGVLRGLHAAHEATNERGEPMNLVHRDVSPQNVLVGADGVARVVDFGVAKAAGRSTTTRDGSLKGKLPYMAPEQLRGAPVTRQTDVWGAAVVLWEALTLQKLFRADADPTLIGKILHDRIKRPSAVVSGAELPCALEDVVMRGLDRDPEARYSTCHEMANALEASLRPATTSEVGRWLESVVGPVLRERAGVLARIEAHVLEAESSNVGVSVPIAQRPPAVEDAATDTVSVTSVARRRRRRIALTVAGALGFVAFAGASTLALVLPARLAAGPSDDSPGEALPPGAIDAAAPASVDVPPPEPKASPVASATTAAAPARSAPAASASAREAAPAARAPVKRATSPARSTRKAESCRTLDAQGIWHVKPECL